MIFCSNIQLLLCNSKTDSQTALTLIGQFHRGLSHCKDFLVGHTLSYILSCTIIVGSCYSQACNGECIAVNIGILI